MKNKTVKTTRMSTAALAGIALASAGSLFAGDYKDKDGHASGTYHKDSDGMTAMMARSIEGSDINLEKGKEVGVIDDFVFSTESGEIEGISIGTGFLGLGGSDHYVEYDELGMYDIGEQNLTTALSMSELEDYSRLDEDSLETREDSQTGIRSGELVAMDLINSDVEGSDGAKQGEVHDWIVDLQTGEVPYVIVSSLQPFGTGAYTHDYYAVSTDTIRGVRDGDLILSVSGEDFASAEQIDDSTPLSATDEGSVRSFRYDSGMAQVNR